MKVCIGIVTHNRAGLLPKAIQSALDQDYPQKEVFVFDDGSTDGTWDLRRRFPAVRWERAAHKAGYLAARNHMMRSTGADLFCSLDDDAWFIQPDALTQAVRLFAAQPDLAAVAYDILSPDRPDPEPRRAPRSVHLFIGCGHLLRLRAVAEAGYYEPGPGYYGGEEKDLSLRLLDQGYEVLLVPGVHVWHDKTSVARDLPDQHRSGVCNDLAFALRRFPMPMVLWKLPGKMFSHLRFSLHRGLVRPCLQGFMLFAGHLGPLVMARAPVSALAIRKFYDRAAQSE